MAAMVAPQPHQLWQQSQRRSTPVMHMAQLPLSSMGPTTSAPPTTRSYQQNHVEMMMTSYPPASMPTAMSFQPGAYGFDLSATMSQFPVQQPYGMNFQQQPLPPHPSTYPSNANSTTAPVPLVRDARNALPSIAHSPTIKSEISSPVHPPPPYSESATTEPLKSSTSDTSETAQAVFSTDVDCLMRAIQAKQPNQSQPEAQPQAPVPVQAAAPVQQYIDPIKKEPISTDSRSKSRKRYQCSMPGCHKSFFQKTHLEIHTRAHTGVKPFVCKAPNCGQRFSQLGNLKTHERRHTGERPYNCDICGKTFAQRGNVRAHKIVHQQIKPFTCKLDDCGKQFTQLGNLKSHQNKFHANTLRYLTSKFATFREGDQVSSQDKDLWEYFSTLYKNSNKGIKGRGKDRRISTTIPSGSSSSTFPSTASFSSASAPAMSRATTNGSIQGNPSDRSSRSSSYTSAQQVVDVHSHSHSQSQHQHHSVRAPQGYHYEEQTGYNNSLFPERRYL